MKKSILKESILTPLFKTLFKGKIKAIERGLKEDPILKSKMKELSKKIADFNEYIDTNFEGYGGTE